MTNNINEKELENVTGGWQYANGSFVNYGSYIVYTIVAGDVLSGIAIRFGVTVDQIAMWNNIKNGACGIDFIKKIGQRFGVSYMQIAQWNNIKNPDLISIGQKLTIYPAVIR